MSRKVRPQTSDFRHRKLRPLGKNKKKDLNLTQFLSLEMLYGHAVFMGNIQKGARYLLLTHPADTNCKTDFNLNNIIATLSFYFFSKKFTGKCHQSVGCYFKPCSFFLFNRRDSAKLEKLNISLLRVWLLPMSIA